MTTPETTPIRLLLLLVLFSVVVDAQKPSSGVTSSDDGDMWEGTANVSPSMAIVVIVLVLGFFITGCIFIYIQHCVDTSSSFSSTATAVGATRIRNENRGLDQSLIDSFPLFHYSAVKELKIGKGALECAVCLSEFQDDETLRFLPKCDHVFHSDCIDAWLVAHSTCPVCRDNLLSLPDSDKPLPDSAVSLTTETNDPASPVLPNGEVQITIPQVEETTSSNKEGRLPRSHSTGHSLVQPGEKNCERFTLRLPTHVRNQLLARTKLRATSLVALPRQSSSRRGFRGGEGSGSSRYGRIFGRSFIMRMGSMTAKVGATPADQSSLPHLPV